VLSFGRVRTVQQRDGERRVDSSEEREPAASLADEAVVARVCGGETQAFEVLMRRYNQRVYRTARAVLRDDGEAEEVMQVAWGKAFAHLRSFAGRARFSTWLTRIAINEALQHRARRRAADASSLVAVTTSSASAEQSALDGELRRSLEAAIDGLSEEYRTTFVLREIEGLSTAETAECLAIAEETVKTRLHRARALLRRHLEARFGVDVRDGFPFGAGRCDRMVASVFAWIADQPAPSPEELSGFSLGAAVDRPGARTPLAPA
jgi:RNA polymerase sigma-70 factor, ECF subfamily